MFQWEAGQSHVIDKPSKRRRASQYGLAYSRSLYHWSLAGWLAGCLPRVPSLHSGLKCKLMFTAAHSTQALSSFMRAIDAQSATVQKARYLADMEQP